MYFSARLQNKHTHWCDKSEAKFGLHFCHGYSTMDPQFGEFLLCQNKATEIKLLPNNWKKPKCGCRLDKAWKLRKHALQFGYQLNPTLDDILFTLTCCYLLSLKDRWVFWGTQICTSKTEEHHLSETSETQNHSLASRPLDLSFLHLTAQMFAQDIYNIFIWWHGTTIKNMESWVWIFHSYIDIFQHHIVSMNSWKKIIKNT